MSTGRGAQPWKHLQSTQQRKTSRRWTYTLPPHQDPRRRNNALLMYPNLSRPEDTYSHKTAIKIIYRMFLNAQISFLHETSKSVRVWIKFSYAFGLWYKTHVCLKRFGRAALDETAQIYIFMARLQGNSCSYAERVIYKLCVVKRHDFCSFTNSIKYTFWYFKCIAVNYR